jgi:hypothetical protein
MIKDQDKLFDKFVAPNDDWMRPILQEPFREGEYVFASDGHSVLRVSMFQLQDPNEYCVNTQFKTNCKFLVVDNCSDVISVERMKEAMKHLPRYRVCKECKGKGEVKFSYNAKTVGSIFYIKETCPACDGYGDITRMHAVKIGDSFFNFRQLIQLRAAAEASGVHSITHTFKSPNLNIFKVSDAVHVGVMAIHLSPEDDHIRKNPIIV